MSKGWYPEVPTQVVVYPQGCIQGCHGCGKRCPSEAIAYVGDTKNDILDKCGCGCSCG